MQDGGQKRTAGINQEDKSNETSKVHPVAASALKTLEKAQLLASIQQDLMAELSGSEEGEVSEVESFILDQEELEGAPILDTASKLLQFDNAGNPDLRAVDPETLEALFEAAGIDKLTTADGKALTDPEILGRLTSSVSSALDEAEAALFRMRAENAGSFVGQGAEGAAFYEAGVIDEAGNLKRVPDEKALHENTEEGESLLSLACSGGYYELAQVLLKMNANVEDRGHKGDCTPLMEAASAGHVGVVKLLLEYGADINATSAAGNTPLMYACSGGHEEVVKVLLDSGANIEDHNENGHTPLMEAASSGHVGIAKVLLDRGAGINTHSNEFKESALTLACYKGHLEMVKFLLEAGADHEHKTDEMHTALMEASMDGHVEVARLLLDHGAQVNMPADSFESPLTLAACGGHVKLAALLIERGANIEEVNDEGYTPLMEAAREGHEEMVALLLAQGANIDAQTEETQETALTLACCGGFLEVAKFLIEVGADIELGCSTPLMEAAQEGHVELVKFLLSKDADVHATTATGDTALTYACENGHTDVADVLLAADADLEHESEGGRTPLMKAARAGHLCTVQYLISRGAEVNRATSNNDHTVLSLACAGGHLPVVELLLAHGADPSHKLKDNSTCLIEASKGGHSGVMALVLGYPHNLVSSGPLEGTLTPPTPESGDIPRVPTQALHTVVPPQEPDKHPDDTQEARHQDSSLLAAATLTSPIGEDLSQRKPTSTSLEDLDAEVAASVLSTNFPTSILERAAKSLPDMKIGKPHGKRSKSAEEQILEKQQIIAELQKVERELQQRMDVTKVQSLTDLSQEALAAAATRGQQTQDPFNFSRLAASEVIISHDKSATQTVRSAGSEANNNKTPGTSHEATSPRIGDVADVDALDMREIKLNHVNQRKPCSKEENSASATSSQEDLRSLSHDVGTAMEHGDINVVFEGAVQPEKVAQLPLRTDSLPNGITSSDAELLRQTASEMADAGNQVSFSAEDVANLQRIAEMAAATPLPDMQTLLGTMEPPIDLGPLEGAGLEMRLGEPGKRDEDRGGDGTDVDAGLLVAAPACSLNDHTSEQDEEHTPAVHKKAAPQTQSVGIQCDSLSMPCRVSSPLTLATSQQSIATHLTDPVSPGDGFDAEPFMPHPPVEIDAQTESNHDTALTIACAGGHDELVQMLLDKQANMEHRDKKGFTPLILAATAGHYKTVEILLNHGADIEAQSERTKDTPLSLACSGGRYDVVDLLLSRGANKEHRNVSDYTPLSLAASGGYVNIIKLLLRYEAEINSRTGSKLGISPLMLAAMNGHTAAVKLLLDMGSDINAQIETNRNTALTLACFQGRTEVVSLLVDRRANVEHRAKTGLTPLMEAASGGYADVGRVLIEKGADVNAPPVPSSRDTALTIAADKGHYRFVELLLSHGAAVDVKNKKGNSPLWLACNGGHLDVVQLLVHAGADIDSQDNRKVSCLMAAFRKGHVKVVRWMVKHVNQFPSDSECMRFIATISDKELLKKCHQCMEIIVAAKDRQAAEANKNASILLEELESEKSREESRKAAAAKRREKKKKKKKEKQLKEVINEPDLEEVLHHDNDTSPSPTTEIDDPVPMEPPTATTTTTIGKVLTTNSQPTTTMANGSAKKSKMMRTAAVSVAVNKVKSSTAIAAASSSSSSSSCSSSSSSSSSMAITSTTKDSNSSGSSITSMDKLKGGGKVISDAHPSVTVRKKQAEIDMVKLDRKEERKERMKEKERKKKNKEKLMGDHSISDHHHHHHHGSSYKSDGGVVKNNPITAASPKRGQKRDDGWKEVVRRSKKVSVPASAISRVIGRGGCNINAIRESTGAHIDVDRQNKGGERTINIKGSADSTRQAHQLIMELIKDPDKDIADIVGKLKKSHSHSSSNHHASTNNNASSSNHPPIKSTTSTTSKGSAIVVTSNVVKNASLSKGNQGLLKAVAPQSVPLSATYAPSLAQAVFPNSIPQFRPPGIPLTQFTPGFQQQAATVPTTVWSSSLKVRAVHPATATAAAQKRQNAAAAAAALALARVSRHGANTSTTSVTSTVTTSAVSSISTSQAVSTKSPRSAGAVRQLFPQQQQQQAVQQPRMANSAVPTSSTAVSKAQVIMASPSNASNPPTFASKIVDTKAAPSGNPKQQQAVPHVSAAVVTPSSQSTHSPVQSMNSVPPLAQPVVSTSATSVSNQTGFSLFNQPSSSHSMGFWGTAVQQRPQQPMPRMEANGEVNLSAPEMAKAPGYKRSSIGSSVQAPVQPSVNAAFLNAGYGAPGSNFTSSQPYNINMNTGIPDQQDYQSAMSSLNANPQYNPIPNPAAHTQPPTPPTTVMSTSSSPISPGTSPRSGTTTPSPVALTSEPPQAIGQDRRLPRPIGNERISRQQRKTPVGFPSIGSDMVNPMGSVANSIWAYNPVDSAGDWMEEMTPGAADFMTATGTTGFSQYQDMPPPPQHQQQQQHPMSHPGSSSHQQQQMSHATAAQQQQQAHMEVESYHLPPHMNMAPYGGRDGHNQEPMHGSLPPSTLGLTNDATQMAMGDGVWNNAVMNSAQEGDPNQMWGVWSQSAM